MALGKIGVRRYFFSGKANWLTIQQDGLQFTISRREHRLTVPSPFLARDLFQTNPEEGLLPDLSEGEKRWLRKAGYASS